MRLLLDTQILVWILSRSNRLSETAKVLVSRKDNLLCFSSLSIWEISIKQRLGHTDFQVDAEKIHQQLIRMFYEEIDFKSSNAIGTGSLPLLHKDPFDRGLLAQALVEGLTLVTADQKLGAYPGPIIKV